MTIKLLCVGKIKARHLRLLLEDYRQRLQKYTSVEYRELKAEKRPKTAKDATIKHREATRLEQHIQPTEWVIALDEHGTQYSSTEFSACIARYQMRSDIKTLVFVTGGATGLSNAFLNNANMVLSLSKMTLPHQLCRLLLLEQLYRAYTILAGTSYHKG
jgi:23S rRNA (pseudouridine1915-N3)-methyltransferase